MGQPLPSLITLWASPSPPSSHIQMSNCLVLLKVHHSFITESNEINGNYRFLFIQLSWESDRINLNWTLNFAALQIHITTNSLVRKVDVFQDKSEPRIWMTKKCTNHHCLKLYCKQITILVRKLFIQVRYQIGVVLSFWQNKRHLIRSWWQTLFDMPL